MLLETKGKRKALVIAISEYEANSGLKPLKFCATGGNEMVALLKKIGHTIEKENELVGNVTGSLLRNRIFHFFQDQVNSDDTLLFYFSGHGILKGNKHYFGTTDINAKIPGATSMLTAEMRNLAENCNAKRVVVILDCCYAKAASGVLALGED